MTLAACAWDEHQHSRRQRDTAAPARSCGSRSRCRGVHGTCRSSRTVASSCEAAGALKTTSCLLRSAPRAVSKRRGMDRVERHALGSRGRSAGATVSERDVRLLLPRDGGHDEPDLDALAAGAKRPRRRHDRFRRHAAAPCRSRWEASIGHDDRSSASATSISGVTPTSLPSGRPPRAHDRFHDLGAVRADDSYGDTAVVLIRPDLRFGARSDSPNRERPAAAVRTIAHRSSCVCLGHRRERATIACPCRRARERPARRAGGEVPRAATGPSPS